MRLQVLAWLVVIAFFSALLILSAPAPARGTVPVHGSFTSAGQTIGYDWFHPAGGVSNAPAIVLLHGSGGILGNVGWIMDFGNQLAARGFNVFVVHYFDMTGDVAVGDRNQIASKFLSWVAAVRDGITFMCKKPGVDVHRVGILGLSLGAYIGLVTASRDRRVQCMVEYCGGFPSQLVAQLRRMPPVLILHGDADSVVPVSEAYRLMGYLDAIHTSYEKAIYPGQNHGLSGAAAVNAQSRALSFFRRQLQR